MNPTLAKSLILCAFFSKALGASVVFPDVYWRDYTGIIPEDAVPGGSDSNNETTYIGQGYVSDRGIIPGVIHPGQKTMNVPVYGTKVINAFIKIMCSSQPQAFKWIPMKADQLHLSSINRYLVPGGIESDHVVNIGRLYFQGEVITGKVVSGPKETPGIAPMYFFHRGSEHRVTSYEVLTVDPDYRLVLPRIVEISK